MRKWHRASLSQCSKGIALAIFAAVLLAGLAFASEAPPGYNITWQDQNPLPGLDAAWMANNAAHSVNTYFTGAGMRLVPASSDKPGYDASLILSGYGFAGEVQPVGDATHSTAGNRIDFVRDAGNLSEFYINAESGIDQFLSLSQPPTGDLPDGPANIHFDFNIAGNLTAKAISDSTIELYRGDGEAVLRWGGVGAMDAEGREMRAWFETPLASQGAGPAVRLVVEAMDAVYPLSLDLRLTSTAPISGGGGSLVAPANDDCTSAITLTQNATCVSTSGTSVDATQSVAPSTCSGFTSSSALDVWYKFVATTTNPTIQMTGTGGMDSIVELRSGACNGAAVTCSDATFGNGIETINATGLTISSTYLVRGYGWGAATPTGTFDMCVFNTAAPSGPANDLCPGAEVIPPAGPFPYLTSTTADITGATTTSDPPLPTCGSGHSRSIWYDFTPATGGSYTISTCADAPTGSTVDDTVLAVYTSSTSACGGTYTQLAGGCDDDSCAVEGLQSVLTTTLTGGTKYFVVVWKFGTSAPTAGNTAVQLRVTANVPPANDTCATAAPLTLNLPASVVTTVAANDYQLSGATCFTGIGQTASTATGRDVVYSFTAPTADKYSFRAQSSGLSNPVLYIASSCPAGTPPVTVTTCLAAANRNSSTSPASEEVMCQTLAAGQTVFVFADESASTAGSTYTVEVNKCTQESGSNDTPATANANACGIEGSITPTNEADFFSLGTPATGARIFALADGLSGSSSDFDLRVTTTTNTLEYDDGDADVPYGFFAPAIGGTKTTGTASYIRVSHFSTSTISEPYRLYSTVQPASGTATAESETNGTIATANAAGNSYFSGTLPTPAPSTDVDVFKVRGTGTIPAGALIFAAADGDPEYDGTCTNLKLEVLDATGTPLQTVNDSNSSSNVRPSTAGLTSTTPVDCAEAVTWRTRTAGVYYVRVTTGATSSTGGSGTYLLSMTTDCTATCDDGNACTVGDAVVNGVCVPGAPVVCSPLDQCHQAGVCNTGTGVCSNPNQPNGTTCSDGSDCTDNDQCTGGSCAGTGVNCNDNNPCTTDNCDVAGGCTHTNNTATCDDTTVCNGHETCSGGNCNPGTPLNCNDGNFCTTDSCDPVDGCQNPNNTLPCDDTTVCNGREVCGGGTCNAGTPLNCNDGNFCTTDSCDPAAGCQNPNNTLPCDDTTVCNGREVCGGGTCNPGTPLNCDDGQCCSVDSCDPVVGCQNVPYTTPPTITAQPSLAGGGSCAYLWPPNHGYVDFSTGDTGIQAAALCGIQTTEFSSCASSQAEDENGVGDGNTDRDCVTDYAALHLRAERDGACSPKGRTYTMAITVADVCGNTATSQPFNACVWHDRGHQPTGGPVFSAASTSNSNDTRPGPNGSYGTGCGTGCGAVCGETANEVHDSSDDDPDNDTLVSYQDNCAETFNLNQWDHNADGEGDACDTNDGIVDGVRFTSPSTLIWELDPTVLYYNVYRGNFRTGVVNFGNANCLFKSSSHPTVDLAIPQVNRGFYYLVTGVTSTGEQTSGWQSSGTERTLGTHCP